MHTPVSTRTRYNFCSIKPGFCWTLRTGTQADFGVHHLQEHLFEQLSKLLATAISQTGKDQLATVR